MSHILGLHSLSPLLVGLKINSITFSSNFILRGSKNNTRWYRIMHEHHFYDLDGVIQGFLSTLALRM